MTDRDCPNCIWRDSNGMCTVWDCNMMTRKEAKNRLTKEHAELLNLRKRVENQRFIINQQEMKIKELMEREAERAV